MARYTNGPLGGFSGTLGPLVGATWRGETIMRTRPTAGPKTYSTAQLLQQQRLKVVQEFLGDLKFLLSETFGSKTDKKPPYNNAMSYHMTEAILVDDDHLVINYPKVLIAKGDLRGIDQPIIALTAPETLNLTWQYHSNQALSYPDDGLVVVAYCPDLKHFEFFMGTHQRSDTACELVLPVAFEGLAVELWATFYNNTKGIAATSTT